jgi:hypothetical protein
MSNYVVIARFTKEKDTQIINLQNSLSDMGYSIPKWPPHITIAAYENFEEKLLCAWTEEYCSNFKKIKVALNSMSILPPGGEQTETAVLCLDPAHSKPFVDFYYGFQKKYEEYCTGIGAFNSIIHDSPIIHATIGIIKIKELQMAMELIFSQNIFGVTKIVALEVYTYPMQLIKRFELRE